MIVGGIGRIEVRDVDLRKGMVGVLGWRNMKDGPCLMAPVHLCPDVYTVLKGRSGRRNGGGKEHGKETNAVTG